MLWNEVDLLRSQLIQWVIKKAALSTHILNSTPADTTKSPLANSSEQSPDADATSAQSNSDKKAKKPKKSKEPPAPIDIARLDLRVGKIIEVKKHPDADALYVEEIDCGLSNTLTVCSGLVNFVTIEQLKDRLVIVLCNVKPAKMRGIESTGMLMCAHGEGKVEVLNPPTGSVVGDLIECDGYARKPDSGLRRKHFDTIAESLATNDQLLACYKGVPLTVAGKGNVTAQTLKNIKIK